jgi:hypothetical protein
MINCFYILLSNSTCATTTSTPVYSVYARPAPASTPVDKENPASVNAKPFAGIGRTDTGAGASGAGAGAGAGARVGRCRLTESKPELKARLVLALETKM